MQTRTEQREHEATGVVYKAVAGPVAASIGIQDAGMARHNRNRVLLSALLLLHRCEASSNAHSMM